MTKEEKAKAYDEALNKLRRYMAQGVDPLITRADVQDFFPELKESEDERIKEAIIATIHLYYGEPLEDEAKEMIAWLEKQGEQKSIDDLSPQEAMDIAVAKCFEQGEQKPVIKMKTPEESLGVSSNEYNKIVDECIYGDDKSTWSKPELKEKEQKPAEWSVEDILMLSSCIEIMLTVDSTEEQQNWLKSLEYRMQPKQEWSKENDLILETIIDHIIPDKPFIANGFTDEELVTWLKSLRPQNRWKPSDEQIKALHDLNLTGNISYAGQGKVLIELYNDLLKLKA